MSSTYDVIINLNEIYFSLCLFFFILFFSQQSFVPFNSKGNTSFFIISKNNVAFSFSSVLLFFSFFVINNTPYLKGFSFLCSIEHNFIITFSKVFVSFFTLGCLFIQENKKRFVFEYYVTILFSVLGIFVIIQSNDFLVLYLGLELQTLSFYILASFIRSSSYSTEAGVKYFIIGAFSSGVFLYGISLVYSYTGLTNYQSFIVLFSSLGFIENSFFFLVGFLFIFFGFFFKLSAAPFHSWSPDVYEGSPTISGLFFVTVPKIVLVGVLSRLCLVPFYEGFFFWQCCFLFFGFFSILIGVFSAFSQKRIKRFLAFSSVTHVGFLLLSFATGTLYGFSAMFFYTIIYISTSFGCWAFLQSFINKKNQPVLFISELFRIGYQNIGFKLCIAFFIFSIAGIPPFAGFGAKLFVFVSAIENKIYFVVFFIILFSVLGSFYYLRVVKGLFFSSALTINSIQSKPIVFLRFSFFGGYFIAFSFFFILFSYISPNTLFLISIKITDCLF